MIVDTTGLCDTVLPLPSPAHTLKNGLGECIDGKDVIRRRPIDDRLRAPFHFARAGQMFSGSAAASTASDPHMHVYAGTGPHPAGDSEGKISSNQELKVNINDPANQTLFDWHARPENKHELHRFGCAMKGNGELAPKDLILNGKYGLMLVLLRFTYLFVLCRV
jgi:hypothetical protein